MKKLFEQLNDLSFDIYPWFNLNQSSYTTNLTQSFIPSADRENIGLQKILKNQRFHLKKLRYKNSLNQLVNIDIYIHFLNYNLDNNKTNAWKNSFDLASNFNSILRLDYSLQTDLKGWNNFLRECRTSLSEFIIFSQKLKFLRKRKNHLSVINKINQKIFVEVLDKIETESFELVKILKEMDTNSKEFDVFYLIKKLEKLKTNFKLLNFSKNEETEFIFFEEISLDLKKQLKQIESNLNLICCLFELCLDQLNIISQNNNNAYLLGKTISYLTIPSPTKKGSFWFYQKEKMFLSALRKKALNDNYFRVIFNDRELSVNIPSNSINRISANLILSYKLDKNLLSIRSLNKLEEHTSSLKKNKKYLSLFSLDWWLSQSVFLLLALIDQSSIEDSQKSQSNKIKLHEKKINKFYQGPSDDIRQLILKKINISNSPLIKSYFNSNQPDFQLRKFNNQLNWFLIIFDYYKKYSKSNSNKTLFKTLTDVYFFSSLKEYIVYSSKRNITEFQKILINVNNSAKIFRKYKFKNYIFKNYFEKTLRLIKKRNDEKFVIKKLLFEIEVRKNIPENSFLFFQKDLNHFFYFSLRVISDKTLIRESRKNILNALRAGKILFEFPHWDFFKGETENNFNYQLNTSQNYSWIKKTLFLQKLNSYSPKINKILNSCLSLIAYSNKIYIKDKKKIQFFEKELTNTSEFLEPYFSNSLEYFLDLFYETKSFKNYHMSRTQTMNPNNFSGFSKDQTNESLFHSLNNYFENELIFFWKYYNVKHYQYCFPKFKNLYLLSPTVDWIDETNLISSYYYSKKITSRGEGGLTSHNATLLDRDIFPDYYGRICPIVSPEGKHVGLVSSFSLFSKLNSKSEIMTPFRIIEKGKLTSQIKYFSSKDEFFKLLIPFDTPLTRNQLIKSNYVYCRYQGKWILSSRHYINGMDISSKQLFSLVTGLIPFLQHNDGARALMGSNMQKQAIPLKNASQPLIESGLEKIAANTTEEGLLNLTTGLVQHINNSEITFYRNRQFTYNNERNNTLFKYPFFQSSIIHNYGIVPFSFYKISNRSNATSRNQIYKNEKFVPALFSLNEVGSTLTSGRSTENGHLALGQNLNIAFLSFQGYTFEDAIVFSDEIVFKGNWSSNHIEEYALYFDPFKLPADFLMKLSKKELLSKGYSIKNYSCSHLDETGLPFCGTVLKPNDVISSRIQVNKINSTLSNFLEKYPEKVVLNLNEFKKTLLKSSWLFIPDKREGIYQGTVTDVFIYSDLYFSIKSDYQFFEKKKSELKTYLKSIHHWFQIFSLSIINLQTAHLFKKKNFECLISWNHQVVFFKKRLNSTFKRNFIFFNLMSFFLKKEQQFFLHPIPKSLRFKKKNFSRQLTPSLVKIKILSTYEVQEGDKISGRHGNKGIISKIMKADEMPYLANGTKIDVLLNPLGISSRMNLGQVYESHLSWSSFQISEYILKSIKYLPKENYQNSRFFKSLISWLFRFEGQNKEILSLSRVKFIELISNLSKKIISQNFYFKQKNSIEFNKWLLKSGLQHTGQVTLYDGLTGQPYDRKVTIGRVHMLKLYHLVRDKYHVRNIGPYNLITQQPLKGRSRDGGQRLGEMEIWSLQAYGAAFTLKEMMTLKSDSIYNRINLDSFIECGSFNKYFIGGGSLDVPASFDAMTKELMGMSLLAKFIKISRISSNIS